MSTQAGLILAIETSDLIGSVALGRAGEVLEYRRLSADRRHTAELVPAIRDVLCARGLKLADVDVLAYSAGPGSFTGLRIAATVARMMHSTVGASVVAVSTLEAIARNLLDAAAQPARVVPVIDARRGQVYGAVYELRPDKTLARLVDAGLFTPAELIAAVTAPAVVVGPGLRQYAEEFRAGGVELADPQTWPPCARQVLAVGQRLAAEGSFCEPHEIVPCYIRPPECEEVYEQRRAAARRRRGE